MAKLTNSMFRRTAAVFAVALALGGCIDDSDDDSVDPVAPGSTPPPVGNTPPAISGTPPAAIAVGESYFFRPSAADPDNDALSFSIINKPAWAGFNNATGELYGQPGAGDVGTAANISINVSDGKTSQGIGPFAITVNESSTPTPPPANSPPVIGGAPPQTVQAGSSYQFQPAASDADNDPLSFSIENRPSWLQFNSANGFVAGTPSDNDIGDYRNITIVVTDGVATASLAFNLNVTAADSSNSAPTISGVPSTTATEGLAYSFRPSAADADNDTLAFSIVNRPGWLQFNSSNGRLSGTPRAADVGVHNGIVISVSDGEATTSLPAFTIVVAEADAPNNAPTIDGTPATEVMVGQSYVFQPTANDADNDPLTFSIVNRPDWLQFNATTGRLEGAPAAADVGTYNGIQMSVSDGTDTASLQPFSVSVVETATGSITLTWTAPTQNDDGSPLTDLAGYKLHYGSSPGSYSTTIDVGDPGLTTYVVENLLPGTYYFAATAVNTDGRQSDYSEEATKVLTTD